MPSRAASSNSASPGTSAAVGVGKVAQDGEMNVRIAIGDGHHLEMIDQVRDAFDRGDQRRDHHHGPRIVRDAAEQVRAAAERSGRTNQCDGALDERDRELADRDRQQQRAASSMQRGGQRRRLPQRGHERDRQQQQAISATVTAKIDPR